MIFIDSLTLKSCLLAYRILRVQKVSSEKKCIHVLDRINNSFKSWLLQKGMRLWSIDVQEAKFYAGHLRTRDGKNIWIAAQNALGKIAFDAVEKSLAGSKLLSALNLEWGQNTILLYLVKYFFRVAGYEGHHTIFKILVADALSRDKKGEKPHLVLGLPKGFTPDLFKDIGNDLNLSTYSITEWSIRKTRLSVLLLITFVSLKRFLKRVANMFQLKPELGDVTTPALLLLQEDDLSIDRSYRGQPHWLFKDDPPPAFRTLVLETNRKLYNEPDRDELERFGVYSVPKETMYCYSEKHAVQKKIKRALGALMYQSVFGSRSFVSIALQLSLLFMKTSLLATFCNGQNVKAFMTCENYHRDADAMNLIGFRMDIHTLSYQYSNMSEIGPIMITTADIMCTFSTLFHDRWSNNSIQPKSFVNVGYPFDSSFSLVVERSRALREQLMNKGVKFIICYFDESVQRKDGKYGLINKEDHYNEILPLLKEIIYEKDIALITKPQFQINALTALFPNDQYIKQAIQTGRFLELHHGKHRNNILPAEAALASDMVIGHVVGATAGLEAALTGKRCVLLNPYEMKGANIDIFKCADILYEDIDSALKAIAAYRNGDEKYRNLGDWSTIIEQFDPFCDGKSSTRLRNFIETKILV